jgi:hypothetical protein
MLRAVTAALPPGTNAADDLVRAMRDAGRY